ncbi:MAG: hypothetical protein WC413_02670 [Candidatus Nanoarchaeia archaeon]
MANAPEKKWRVSNMEVVVWDNKKEKDGAEYGYKTVSLVKSFKKKDEDVWRSDTINNLRRTDIPKMIALLNKAQDYLFFEANKEHEGEEE